METLKKDTPKHSFILLFSFKTTARKKKKQRKNEKQHKPKTGKTQKFIGSRIIDDFFNAVFND